jgi:hypothetical protein
MCPEKIGVADPLALMRNGDAPIEAEAEVSGDD